MSDIVAKKRVHWKQVQAAPGPYGMYFPQPKAGPKVDAFVAEVVSLDADDDGMSASPLSLRVTLKDVPKETLDVLKTYSDAEVNGNQITVTVHPGSSFHEPPNTEDPGLPGGRRRKSRRRRSQRRKTRRRN